jgi:hypothetical protein
VRLRGVPRLGSPRRIYTGRGQASDRWISLTPGAPNAGLDRHHRPAASGAGAALVLAVILARWAAIKAPDIA